MIRLVLLLLVAGLCPLLAGCADEAEPCTISDNGDGTSTLRCNGESFVVAGGSSGSDCTLVLAEDGSGIITCADGRVIHLDADGRPIFPGKGTITGSAQYYGLDDHAGIVVRAVGTPYSTTTDAKGQYQLTGLPAGVYALSFEGRDRVPERLENVTALDGLFVAAPVVLRLGLPISGQDPGQLAVIESPRKDAFAVSEGSGSARLKIWDTAKRLGTVLSATATGPRFSKDGRYLLFLEDRSRDGQVVVWDVDERRAETIYDGAWGAMFLGDGHTVLVFAESVVLVDVETKDAVPLPDSRSPGLVETSPDGKTVAWTQSDGQLAFWDVEGRTSTDLDVFFPSEIRFTPDGRDAVIAGLGPDGVTNVVFHWDVRAGIGSTWWTSVGWVDLSSVPFTNRYVLFNGFDGASRQYQLWVRGEAAPRLLGANRDVAPALGDDALLLWTTGVSSSLSLYDVASGSSTLLATNVTQYRPGPDGRSVLVESNAGEWELIGLPSKKRTAIEEAWSHDWSADGAWLLATGPGSSKVIRASTGRAVDLGNVEVRGLTESGTGVFFLVHEEEEGVHKRYLGLWDLGREEADMLGLLPDRTSFRDSRSGRTVFLFPSGGGTGALSLVTPRTGARELVDADATSSLWLFDRFLLHGTAEGGAWLVTSFE